MKAAYAETQRRWKLELRDDARDRRSCPFAEPLRDEPLFRRELAAAEQLELDLRSRRRPHESRLDAMPTLALQLVVHQHLVVGPFDPAHVPQPAREHDTRLERAVSRVPQAHLRERTAPEGSPQAELVAAVDAHFRVRTRRTEPGPARSRAVRERAR